MAMPAVGRLSGTRHPSASEERTVAMEEEPFDSVISERRGWCTELVIERQDRWMARQASCCRSAAARAAMRPVSPTEKVGSCSAAGTSPCRSPAAHRSTVRPRRCRASRSPGPGSAAGEQAEPWARRQHADLGDDGRTVLTSRPSMRLPVSRMFQRTIWLQSLNTPATQGWRMAGSRRPRTEMRDGLRHRSPCRAILSGTA